MFCINFSLKKFWSGYRVLVKIFLEFGVWVEKVYFFKWKVVKLLDEFNCLYNYFER